MVATTNLVNIKLGTTAHPTGENADFFFQTIYEDERIALCNAILSDNMEVIPLIMNLGDDVTYFHRVDRSFRESSASLAKEAT